MENQAEKHPEPKSGKILNHILGDLNNRRGFRQEYQGIEDDKEVSEDESRTGIARQLVKKINPFI